MSVLVRLKPDFWDHEDVAAGPYKHLFNFRRIWKLTVLLMVVANLVPLIALTLMDYRATKNSVKSEIMLRTSQLISNTSRNVSFFFSLRRSALDFIVKNHMFSELKDPKQLTSILENLNRSFGGFEDLGVIEDSGTQVTYVGPYHLEDADYSGQRWYRKVLAQGKYIGNMHIGLRNSPHTDMAVKQNLPDGTFYLLRASLDTGLFNNLISQIEVRTQGDAFIIDREGALQTPSHPREEGLTKVAFTVPKYSPDSRVIEHKIPGGAPAIVGYSYLPIRPLF